MHDLRLAALTCPPTQKKITKMWEDVRRLRKFEVFLESGGQQLYFLCVGGVAFSLPAERRGVGGRPPPRGGRKGGGRKEGGEEKKEEEEEDEDEKGGNTKWAEKGPSSSSFLSFSRRTPSQLPLRGGGGGGEGEIRKKNRKQSFIFSCKFKDLALA